ncbi:MAG: hypothetical protein ACI9QL_002891 [Candidatus Omnitrophota bacterium]|jgi:hypothetical protein
MKSPVKSIKAILGEGLGTVNGKMDVLPFLLQCGSRKSSTGSLTL